MTTSRDKTSVAMNLNSLLSGKVQLLLSLIHGHGGRARLIGGAVRDAILGLDYKDLDVATDLLPEEVLLICAVAGLKVLKTGMAFGTLTVIIDGELFQVTTLRRDIKTDGRHAVVEYTTDFEIDAARRDFTINALSYDPACGVVYDYFGGLTDLKNRVVRFIGDPSARIIEDHLRILRFFRFSAFYSEQIEANGLAACVSYGELLNDLSRERIKSEIDRLLLSRHAPLTLEIMCKSGIWSFVFRGSRYCAEYLARLWQVFDDFHIQGDICCFYAVLFLFEKYTVSDLLSFGFCKRDAKRTMDLISIGIDAQTLIFTKLKRILISQWLSSQDYREYFILAAVVSDESHRIIDLYSKLSVCQKPKFPVKSETVLALGYKGADIQKIISMLRYRWIDSDFALTEEDLIASVDDIRAELK